MTGVSGPECIESTLYADLRGELRAELPRILGVVEIFFQV